MTPEQARAGAADVRRQVDTIAAHVRRCARAGRTAETSRTMEWAFETSGAHGDAVAALLIRRSARARAQTLYRTLDTDVPHVVRLSAKALEAAGARLVAADASEGAAAAAAE